MTAFDERLSLALPHEQRVIAMLRDRGWMAEPFGQAQLSPAMRELLRRTSTPVRWMPDIIAARRTGEGGALVAFVDAKAGDTYLTTHNHAIELNAALSAAAWIKYAGVCDLFFVFDDEGVLTPRDVLEFGTYHPGSRRGSGTPFMLVSTVECRHLDAIFGSPEET